MNNIIKISQDHNQLVVSSRQVAEHFKKEHKDILESIRNLTAENSATKLLYHLTSFHNRGKQYPMYLMNRDGFSLLVMGFTGKSALNWKMRYIEAFNNMEATINEKNLIKEKEVDAKLMNAKTRLANVWLKLANLIPNNKEYSQICASYASEIITGQKVISLPACNERYYTATQIAEIIGSNKNTVGKKAKQAGIRPIDENHENKYGKWFFDKSPYSNKEVSSFRYNELGLESIKKLFNEQQAIKKGSATPTTV